MHSQLIVFMKAELRYYVTNLKSFCILPLSALDPNATTCCTKSHVTKPGGAWNQAKHAENKIIN